ncbi:hypothetical protein AALP_AA2G113500 [Arabis alpina]|uniref:Uncharacterized protein n=1 Tax=Arabis alpina TaxID=50452 RepID=A0A087HGQ7_ARAAL|nr:hypothetical protein AALP_AA2G113500 [Arabis alpina]
MNKISHPRDHYDDTPKVNASVQSRKTSERTTTSTGQIVKGRDHEPRQSALPYTQLEIEVD